MDKTTGQVIVETELGTETKDLLIYDDEEQQNNRINKANSELLWAPKFIPFYPEVMKKYELTYSETLLFGFLDFFFSTAPESSRFYFTNEQVSNVLHCDEKTITRSILKLKEKGIINPKYKIKAGGGTVRFINKDECQLLEKMSPSSGHNGSLEQAKCPAIDNKIIHNKDLPPYIPPNGGTKELTYHVFEKTLCNQWNDFCSKHPSVAKLLEITQDRRRKIKQRFKNKSFQEFEFILKAIERQSDFLFGNNDKKWVITFDWLIANDTNYVKVLEGRYLRRTHDKRSEMYAH